MDNAQFTASVRQARELAVIEMQGEINAAADAALNTAYAQAISGGSKNVLLNFTQVDYINSTGIALIVGLLAQARKSGAKLLTCGLSAHYQEIFKITRLSDFMTIVPDEASALQRTNRQGP